MLNRLPAVSFIFLRKKKISYIIYFMSHYHYTSVNFNILHFPSALTPVTYLWCPKLTCLKLSQYFLFMCLYVYVYLGTQRKSKQHGQCNPIPNKIFIWPKLKADVICRFPHVEPALLLLSTSLLKIILKPWINFDFFFSVFCTVHTAVFMPLTHVTDWINECYVS